MGRFAFVLLIVSAPLCLATGDSIAQEEKSLSVQSSINVAAETEKVGEVDSAGLPSETRLANNSKTKPSLLEEVLSSPLNYVLLLVMCFYVYLMFIQPRNARLEKKLKLERMNSLKKNDRVVTTSGIHGIVSNINTDAGTVTLRVDENSNAKLTIDRDSIRSVAG
jgi:preprotein translocase YajC subunit